MKKMISLIVAYSQNRVIGNQNLIPWHLPDDMKQFKNETKDHVVIMGRKTYESIPEKFRPLPKRFSIVLTNNPDYHIDHESARAFTDLEKALLFAEMVSDKDVIYIAGGEEIYRLFLPIATYIHATEVYKEVDGDAYFPELDPKSWEVDQFITNERRHRNTYTDEFQYITYKRLGK